MKPVPGATPAAPPPMAAAPRVAPQDRVPAWEKASLGVGALTAFFGYAGAGILAYPVYNMMLGVNAGLVGLALMVPRLWDAVTDPVMGKLSDNTHTRLGRRRPYIIAGAWTMGILFALMWHVPEAWSDQAKIAFFIGMQLLYFTAYTVFSVPFGSLSYELTPDYNERTSVMAFLAFFHKAGEFLGGWMLPMATALGVLLLGAAVTRGADGSAELSMAGVHAMGWIVGIGVMAVLGSLPGLLVRERFARKTAGQRKVGLVEGGRAALSSKPFIVLVVVIILNTLSGVLASGIDQYLLVYYMNDGSEAAGLVHKGVLTSGYAIVGFASIPVISWLASRFGKKGSLYFVYGLMALGGIMKWFIFTPGHSIWSFSLGSLAVRLDPVILIDPLLCGPMWVAVKIMLASMMADIVDEDERLHGLRREGLFSSVFSWLEKMVLSLAFAGTGIALNMSGFDPALGGAQGESTFTAMRLFLAGAPTATALLALVALRFYPITAETAARTRAILEQRRGAANLSELSQNP